MRRLISILAVLATAALPLAGCGGNGSQDAPNADATIVLDFTPNAVHSGIYTTIARGFDTAEGVKLHVRVPGSSTDSAKLLLSGRTDFAVLDIHDLALAREQGRDLVAVMALVQQPLAAVLAAPAVRSPRDLEGRKVGVTGVPSDDAVLRSIVKGAGGDPAKVQRVTIGFNAVPALLGGKVAGATAFWDVEGVTLKQRRPRTREFRVDDYGAPSYPELVLVTTGSRLRQDPSVARATVAALVRGYGTASDDPAGSLSDLQSRVPGLDRTLLRAEMDALAPAISPPDGQIGRLVPATLRAWARWEVRFGIVKRTPDVSRMFDTTLVPPSRDRSGS
jgi:ABC-type nitrate/sulfonate/bicarbonate transport system substrate-binding protein